MACKKILDVVSKVFVKQLSLRPPRTSRIPMLEAMTASTETWPRAAAPDAVKKYWPVDGRSLQVRGGIVPNEDKRACVVAIILSSPDAKRKLKLNRLFRYAVGPMLDSKGEWSRKLISWVSSGGSGPCATNFLQGCA